MGFRSGWKLPNGNRIIIERLMLKRDKDNLPRWLPAARLAWVALFGLILLVWGAGFWEIGRQPVSDCQAAACDPVDFNRQDLEVAQSLGLQQGIVVGAFTVGYNLLSGGLYFLVSLWLFWRRSDDGMALLVSLTLAFLGGIVFTSTDDAFVRAYPDQAILREILVPIGIMLVMFLFFVFPDGRFRPRRWRPVWILAILVYPISRLLALFLALGETFPLQFSLLVFPVAIFAQIYRYRRISSPTEKQQTKWVVLGLVGVIAFMIGWGIIATVYPPDQPSPERLRALLIVLPLGLVFALLLPLAFTFSILRYRLWDIDVLVRRTVGYVLLTGILVAIYFGVIVLLQGVVGRLSGQENTPLVTVISTLAIAALFNPLRTRVQAFIDRRFYRRKYNAERTLGNFARMARDEVDLDNLAGAMLGVVDETLQPEEISFWLKSMD